ncbi:MAG TPA: GNAT family N-acetyltransferase [Patescibacteria group bacterium]|nr:GNAT family N-acetyltransferase [Patescibacteria group bacterium]
MTDNSPMENIVLRIAEAGDIPALERIATAMKAVHEENYFERSLGDGRTILLAEQAGRAVAYVQINWKPLYAPFRRFGLPEIQDLNTVPGARRQGIGARMVSWCEDYARQRGHADIGISVGLAASYGAAQRLYVRLGYVPDGAGACYDDVPVQPGARYAADDLFTLKLVKSLGAG